MRASGSKALAPNRPAASADETNASATLLPVSAATPRASIDALDSYGSAYATSEPGNPVWMLPICTTMYCFPSCR